MVDQAEVPGPRRCVEAAPRPPSEIEPSRRRHGRDRREERDPRAPLDYPAEFPARRQQTNREPTARRREVTRCIGAEGSRWAESLIIPISPNPGAVRARSRSAVALRTAWIEDSQNR